MTQSRRRFLTVAAGGVALAFVRSARGMQPTQARPTMSGPMEQDAYIPVKHAPKSGAGPSMTDGARDDLEHKIKCQCGCPLDVFTCRTTDFTCPVAPAMHADVMGLVAGGYAANEILDAFQNVYGEKVLMSPPPRGFNLLGYVLPFAVLGAGAVTVATLIRRWGRAAVAEAAPDEDASDATQAELDRLQAAMRDDR